MYTEIREVMGALDPVTIGTIPDISDGASFIKIRAILWLVCFKENRIPILHYKALSDPAAGRRRILTGNAVGMKVWQSSFYDAPYDDRTEQLRSIQHKSSSELLDWLRSEEGNQGGNFNSLHRKNRHQVKPPIKGMVHSSTEHDCEGTIRVGVSDFLMAGLRPPPRRRHFIQHGVSDSAKQERNLEKDDSNSAGHAKEEFAKLPFGKPSPRLPSQALPAISSSLGGMSIAAKNSAAKNSPRKQIGATKYSEMLRIGGNEQMSQIVGLPKLDEDIFSAHASMQNVSNVNSGRSPRVNISTQGKPVSTIIDSWDKRNLVINEALL